MWLNAFLVILGKIFTYVRSPKLCNETNWKLFHHKDLRYCVGDPLKGEHHKVNKVCPSVKRCLLFIIAIMIHFVP